MWARMTPPLKGVGLFCIRTAVDIDRSLDTKRRRTLKISSAVLFIFYLLFNKKQAFLPYNGILKCLVLLPDAEALCKIKRPVSFRYRFIFIYILGLLAGTCKKNLLLMQICLIYLLLKEMVHCVKCELLI